MCRKNVHCLVFVFFTPKKYYVQFSRRKKKQDTRQKGGDLTQSYDKSPYTNRNVKRENDNTSNATKKFDLTAIADRLRTVSWSNYSYPTGVVNLVYGPPSHSPQQPCNQNDTH